MAGPAPVRGELNGAAGLASPTSAPATAASEATPKQTAAGVLVVDGVGGEAGGNTFATLEQACGRAASGDVIELRYSGPREERPLVLNNRKITIRAQKPYQPVIVFRQDAARYARAMITLNGCELNLINVGIELAVPRERQADRWSLFEIRQSKATRLERCSLTIRNASEEQGAYQQDVAFFRVKAPPGTGMSITEPPGTSERTGLALLDCVVRGEANVVVAHDLRPLQFTWENGLLVTTERLLLAEGGERTPPPADDYVLLLRHLTAIVRGGLCRFNQSESAPKQLPARIMCTNSILMAAAGAPLIEQMGVGALERPLERIDWSGDRNFYEGFTVFWSIQRSNPELPPETMDFDAWRSHWQPQREGLPLANRVQWAQLPTGDLSVSSHTPADYALKVSSGLPNPAIGGASDGGDVGCLAERLPTVTAASTASATEKPAASGNSP